MRAFIPLLVVLPTALGGLVPATLLGARDVSPDLTCGKESGYSCPESDKCCSRYGFCGSDDSFCLTTAGCQGDYSNSTSDCHEPKEGVSTSVDGTCGTTGAGEHGYVCAATGASCCSAAGYCGNTTSHCSADEGCQSAYGSCHGNSTNSTSNATASTSTERSLPVNLFV